MLLAERMGFDDPCFRDSEDDMIRDAARSGHPFLEGITLERLEREHSVRLNVCGQRSAVPAVRRGRLRHTPSGKCEFGAETLDYTPPVESRLGDAELRARYPLELISSKNDDSMNSTFGYRGSDRCADRSPHAPCAATPHRAASRPATRCACSTIAAAVCTRPR